MVTEEVRKTGAVAVWRGTALFGAGEGHACCNCTHLFILIFSNVVPTERDFSQETLDELLCCRRLGQKWREKDPASLRIIQMVVFFPRVASPLALDLCQIGGCMSLLIKHLNCQWYKDFSRMILEPIYRNHNQPGVFAVFKRSVRKPLLYRSRV